MANNKPDLSWQRKQAEDRRNYARSNRRNSVGNSSNQNTLSDTLNRNRQNYNANLYRKYTQEVSDSNEDVEEETPVDDSEQIIEENQDINQLQNLKETAKEVAKEAAKEAAKKKVKTFIVGKLLILAPYIIIGFAIFFLIFILVDIIQYYFPFFTYDSNSAYSYNYTLNDGNYLTSENEKELRAKEQAFYDELDKIRAEFQEKLGVTIDTDYIIGALFYENMALNFLEEEDITNKDFTEAKNPFEYGLQKIYTLAQYQIVTNYYQYSNEFSVYPEDKREIAANDPADNPWEWFINMFTGWQYVEKNVQTHYGEYENLDPVYTVDVSKEGVFYWNLVDEEFITTYYSGSFSSDMTQEELEKKKIEIVEGIYQFVEDYKKAKHGNYGYLTDGLRVNLYTCDYEAGGRGYAVSTLANEGTNYPSYTNFRDYIKGAIYGEVTSSLVPEAKEAVKAFVIAFSSYALNRSGYNSGDTEIDVHVGDCWQLSCSTQFGCQYCHSKIGRFGTNITGADSKCPHGKIHSKPILDPEKNAWFDSIIDEVFGMVLISNKTNKFMWAAHMAHSGLCGKNCMGQSNAVQDAKNGMTYEQILDKYYDDYTIVNIKEDLYVQNVQYGNGSVNLNEAFHYHQGDYRNVKFCGRNTSIAVAGCGTTSAAIVASLLTGRKVDPVEMMQYAHSVRACGSGILGTDVSILAPKVAEKYGFVHTVVWKRDTAKVIEALKTGRAVVIGHVPKGTTGTYSTSSGHYLTLVAVNSNGKVLVWDPGSRSKSRDGVWQDMNFMAKYLDRYHIFMR